MVREPTELAPLSCESCMSVGFVPSPMIRAPLPLTPAIAVNPVPVTAKVPLLVLPAPIEVVADDAVVMSSVELVLIVIDEIEVLVVSVGVLINRTLEFVPSPTTRLVVPPEPESDNVPGTVTDSVDVIDEDPEELNAIVPD